MTEEEVASGGSLEALSHELGLAFCSIVLDLGAADQALAMPGPVARVRAAAPRIIRGGAVVGRKAQPI